MRADTLIQGENSVIKKVILVFKTHFDIGFTDLSKNVIDNYSTDMLDQVLAYEVDQIHIVLPTELEDLAI